MKVSVGGSLPIRLCNINVERRGLILPKLPSFALKAKYQFEVGKKSQYLTF